MLIIGEKINGTRSGVAQAIANRDAKTIQALATRQVDAGADWLDINAGTPPDRELEDLVWLVQTVQSVVDVSLCLDSANADALTAALQAAAQTAVINSISGEETRLSSMLPLISANNCPVIALLLDNNGIPKTSRDRVGVAARIVQATRAHGIPDDRVYLDPLTLTLASDSTSGKTALETMNAVHHEFPGVKLCLGLSNVSFGLPGRSYVNRVFLTLALGAGLDAAILDPLDPELQITLLAAKAVLGQDKKRCVNYIRSYRRIMGQS